MYMHVGLVDDITPMYRHVGLIELGGLLQRKRKWEGEEDLKMRVGEGLGGFDQDTLSNVR